MTCKGRLLPSLPCEHGTGEIQELLLLLLLLLAVEGQNNIQCPWAAPQYPDFCLA